MSHPSDTFIKGMTVGLAACALLNALLAWLYIFDGQPVMAVIKGLTAVAYATAPLVLRRMAGRS